MKDLFWLQEGKKENMAVTGSANGQPQFISSSGNRSLSKAPLIENSDTHQIVVPDVSLGCQSNCYLCLRLKIHCIEYLIYFV